jgi:hypothetical protein
MPMPKYSVTFRYKRRYKSLAGFLTAHNQLFTKKHWPIVPLKNPVNRFLFPGLVFV